MNNQTKQALKMAIEHLNYLYDITDKENILETIQACKEALAQPAQEPKTFKNLSDEEKKQVYKVAKRIQKAIGVETVTIAANACLLNIELSCWIRKNL